MTEIEKGNTGSVQGLSVAVDTHRQHSLEGLVAVLDAARGLTVVVVGDLLLDEYLHGGAARVAREAPVPAVTVTNTEAVPGGAGNVAANLAALGANVKVVGVVGDDEAGSTLRTSLRDAGVDDSCVVTAPGRRTVVKRRLVADGQLIARFDEGDRTAPTAAVLAELGRHARRLERHADAVVVSDYRYGTVGDPIVRALAPARRRGRGVLTLGADPPAIPHVDATRPAQPRLRRRRLLHRWPDPGPRGRGLDD